MAVSYDTNPAAQQFRTSAAAVLVAPGWLGRRPSTTILSQVHAVQQVHHMQLLEVPWSPQHVASGSCAEQQQQQFAVRLCTCSWRGAARHSKEVHHGLGRKVCEQDGLRRWWIWVCWFSCVLERGVQAPGRLR